MKHAPKPLRLLIAASRAPEQFFPLLQAHLEALYDSVEALGDQVEGEWLWPATPENLAARLEARKQPAIDILYLEARLPSGQPRDILPGRRVPLLILAVAPQDEGRSPLPEEELTQFLASNSSPNVVVLDGRLSAGQIKLALTALLTSLAGGHAARHAVEEAQRGLRSVTTEHPRPWADAGDAPPPETAIRLARAEEGQPLLVVDAAAPQGVGKVVQFPGGDLTPPWQLLAQQPEPGGLPPEPMPGFFGRNKELAALENALRGAPGVVLVQGKPGMGKTTLAAHAARWLARAGRFEQVVYSSFLGGGNAEQALYDLGKRLAAQDWSLHEQDPLGPVVQALQKTPTLILWDNLQAILPGGEFALESQDLEKLLHLGFRLAHTGNSRLCVLSENPTIPGPAYSEELALNLTVEGLETDEGLSMLQALLANPAIPMPSREEARALVVALGGHPLALRLLTPLLQAHPLVQVMGRLEDLVPGFRAGAARLGNKVLDTALQTFTLALDEPSRNRLQALGLFVEGFMAPMISTVSLMEKTEWEELHRAIAATRLVLESQIAGLSVPYITVAPTIAQLLASRLEEARRRDWTNKLYNSYLALMAWIMQREKQLPEVMRSLVRLELPNLRRGLITLLNNEQMDTGIEFARLLDHHLRHLGFYNEGDKLATHIRAAAVKALSSERPMERETVRFLFTMTEQLATGGHIQEALALLTKLRERMQAASRKEPKNGLAYKGYDAIVDHASTLRRLGGYKLTTGQEAPAIEHYTEAVGLLRALPPNETLQQELIELYNSLGEAQLAALDLDRANEAYQAGLNIAAELKNERAVGLMYTRLAAVTMVRNDNAHARELLEEAILHLAAAEDNASIAATWNQLATLALRVSDLSEATRCYEQALEFAEKAEQPTVQAQVCVRLARLAEQSGQEKEAQARYEQAVRLFDEQKMPLALASTEMDLAGLLLRAGKPKQARIHAEKARPIIEKVGPEAKPWEVYALLERIAKVEGQAEKESHWHARAQESFAESSEAKKTLEHWQGIIDRIAGACRGEALDSKLVDLLDSLEAAPQWQGLVAAVWRILGGEHGPELYTDLEPVPALLVRQILKATASPEVSPKEGE